MILGASALVPVAVAANPSGSAVELFLEPGISGDPANRITGSGFWGHEGADRLDPTVVSADLLDGGSGFLDAFGASSLDHFALVFAPTSADGSAEQPEVTAGETIAEAYPWFTALGLQDALTGSADPALDEVLTVSTKAEFDAWVEDGRPEQRASSDDLVHHDVARPDSPVSKAPRGRSILNRWASGELVSAIIVRTTGEVDPEGVPLVDASAGRAQAAWIPFLTRVDPALGDAAHPGVATSGGYVLDDLPDPDGVTAASAPPGTDGYDDPADPSTGGQAETGGRPGPGSRAASEGEAGPLTVSTPYTPESPLDVGHLVLSADATSYTGSAELAGVVVVDERVGEQPWLLTVEATSLTSGSGAVIDARNIGLVDLVADVRSGDGVAAATDLPAAEPPVAPGPGGAGNPGPGPRTVLVVTRGPGVVELSGLLVVVAPVSTRPGHFTGTVTFTVS